MKTRISMLTRRAFSVVRLSECASYSMYSVHEQWTMKNMSNHTLFFECLSSSFSFGTSKIAAEAAKIIPLAMRVGVASTPSNVKLEYIKQLPVSASNMKVTTAGVTKWPSTQSRKAKKAARKLVKLSNKESVSDKNCVSNRVSKTQENKTSKTVSFLPSS